MLNYLHRGGYFHFVCFSVALCGSCSVVYCNWSCLWVCLCVCGSVTMITGNCVYWSSPNTRSSRGSTTDPQRPSTGPRDTAASLAVSTFYEWFSNFVPSASYRPWILLGGLQARVRYLFSPATAFDLQYRRCGSCHTQSSLGDRAFPVAGAWAWNALPPSVTSSPSLSSFRRLLKTIPSTSVWWVLKCWVHSNTTLILANWTELNW